MKFGEIGRHVPHISIEIRWLMNNHMIRIYNIWRVLNLKVSDGDYAFDFKSLQFSALKIWYTSLML